MESERNEYAASVGLLILRLGIGGYLVTHGWGKVQMLLAGAGGQFGDPIGLGPTASLVLVATAEFLCALLIIVGLGTRFAAVPVVISMSVAAFVVHARDPWTMETAARAFMAGTSKTWFAKEPALLYLVPFLALVFTGGGMFSLDRWIALRGNRGRESTLRNSERLEKRSAA
ncbi:MAG: DoxX family protein [Deltaproteobacteria bacterium]|nr:DoxX family protein [Deltaproteobacteria bacterium]